MSSLQHAYYAGGDSWLARIDPRVKLAYVAWVFVMIIVFSHPAYQAFALSTLLIGVYLGRLRVWDVIRAGRFGLYVGVASWLLWIIFLNDEGRTLFSIAGRPVTNAGVLVGLSAALRIASVLFAFLIVAMTTAPRDVIAGLYGLRAPVVLAMALGLTLRLIPQLRAEHATVVDAQRSRAAEFDRGRLLTRLRQHTSYLIPLTLRALKIASELSVAMESRAFDPYAPRTLARPLRLQPVDAALLAGLGVTLIVGILVRLSGLGDVASSLLR